jgi:hypothetical protein
MLAVGALGLVSAFVPAVQNGMREFLLIGASVSVGGLGAWLRQEAARPKRGAAS